MSMNALLAAAVTTLRTGLSLSDKQCGEQPKGQPPPACGQLYYAVHQGQWSGNSPLAAFAIMGLQVTITQRSPVVPIDRQGESLYQQIRDKADVVADLLHMNYSHMNAANALIGSGKNGFVEPIEWQSCTLPEVKAADWFWSDDEAYAGVAITVIFTGAKRVRVLRAERDEGE